MLAELFFPLQLFRFLSAEWAQTFKTSILQSFLLAVDGLKFFQCIIYLAGKFIWVLYLYIRWHIIGAKSIFFSAGAIS